MRTRRRRVLVTGMGMVTPIGIGIKAFTDGLHAAKSAVDIVRRFDTTGYRSHMAAEIRSFEPTEFFTGRQLRRLDRYAQLALAAAQMAVTDADLDLSIEDRDRVGVSMGSALGGLGIAEEQHGVFVRDGLRAVNLVLALAVYGGSSNCNIAIDMGITGLNLAHANSCASGSMAIGEGMLAIRQGRADVMLCGGAESPIHPLCYGAFDIIKAMSTRNDEPQKSCRPFDKDRDGFVMGEGSAVMVLEEMGHAQSRGARVYGEVIGYGCTNDAYHMTAPHPDGTQAARAMACALADSGIKPADVDYINAHGSSTPLNDKAETLSIKSVFGEHAYRVPVSGTKAMHGHSLGASGAVEGCASLLSIYKRFIPPTVNLECADEECDLDYVPHAERRQDVSCILSNSFGFGGINSALVFQGYQG